MPSTCEAPVVVVNASAGQHPSAADVRALLAGAGVDAEAVESSSADDVAVITRRAVAEQRSVIVAGGDGTVQLAGREMLDTGVPLGILPFGRSMNIARGLGIPLVALDAARVIARGHVRGADVGEVNGHVFFESAGIGLDAEVFAAAHAARDRSWRRMWRRVVRWATQDTHRIHVHGEHGHVSYRALQVLVLNSPFYTWAFPVGGGGMHDGLLDVAIFPRMGRFALLRSLVRLAREGRHEAPPIVLREREVRIEAASPLPIQADTRSVGTLPATFRCRPGALRVYVPEEPAG